MWSQRQDVGRIADRREFRAPEQLYWRRTFERGEIERRVLNESRKVCDNENHLVLVSASEREHTMVIRIEKLEGPAAERLVALSHGNEPFHPPQHGMRIVHGWKVQPVRACL